MQQQQQLQQHLQAQYREFMGGVQSTGPHAAGQHPGMFSTQAAPQVHPTMPPPPAVAPPGMHTGGTIPEPSKCKNFRLPPEWRTPHYPMGNRGIPDKPLKSLPKFEVTKVLSEPDEFVWWYHELMGTIKANNVWAYFDGTLVPQHTRFIESVDDQCKAALLKTLHKKYSDKFIIGEYQTTSEGRLSACQTLDWVFEKMTGPEAQPATPARTTLEKIKTIRQGAGEDIMSFQNRLDKLVITYKQECLHRDGVPEDMGPNTLKGHFMEGIKI